MIVEAGVRVARLRPDGPDEMGRELAEGPRAVAETLAAADRLAPELRELRRGTKRVILVGTGASVAMALAAEPWFRAAATLTDSAKPHSSVATTLPCSAPMAAPTATGASMTAASDRMTAPRNVATAIAATAIVHGIHLAFFAVSSSPT